MEPTEPYLPPSEPAMPSPDLSAIPAAKDVLSTEDHIAEINAKLDTIQAMMMEVMEWKAELEQLLADFQPPNMMKMIGNLFAKPQ